MDDKILNPATGKYVLKTGKIGKLLLQTKSLTKASSGKTCNPEVSKYKLNPKLYICNPQTGNWVLKDGEIGKVLVAAKSPHSKSKLQPPPSCNPTLPKYKANPKLYICNPVTKNLVLKTSTTGKKLLLQQPKSKSPYPKLNGKSLVNKSPKSPKVTLPLGNKATLTNVNKSPPKSQKSKLKLEFNIDNTKHFAVLIVDKNHANIQTDLQEKLGKYYAYLKKPKVIDGKTYYVYQPPTKHKFSVLKSYSNSYIWNIKYKDFEPDPLKQKSISLKSKSPPKPPKPQSKSPCDPNNGKYKKNPDLYVCNPVTQNLVLKTSNTGIILQAQQQFKQSPTATKSLIKDILNKLEYDDYYPHDLGVHSYITFYITKPCGMPQKAIQLQLPDCGVGDYGDYILIRRYINSYNKETYPNIITKVLNVVGDCVFKIEFYYKNKSEIVYEKQQVAPPKSLQQPKQQPQPKPKSPPKPKCDPNSPKAKDPKYICNPATNTWVMKTSAIGKKLLNAINPDMILNPATGKYVYKSGAIGKKLVQYGSKPPPTKPPKPKIVNNTNKVSTLSIQALKNAPHKILKADKNCDPNDEKYKAAPGDYVCNPFSGNWVLKNSTKGQKAMAIKKNGAIYNAITKQVIPKNNILYDILQDVTASKSPVIQQLSPKPHPFHPESAIFCKPDKYGKLFKKQLQFVAALDKASMAALKSYTGSGYSSINNCLRKHINNGGCSANVKNNINIIDKVFESIPALDKDVVVWRSYGVFNIKDKDVYVEPAYSSVTAKKGTIGGTVKKGTIGGNYIEIHVPKGTKVIPLISCSNFISEVEVLLPRNTEYTRVKHLVKKSYYTSKSLPYKPLYN